MDFVKKFLLFYVVFHTTICSAEGENDTACFVPYLKAKGKLNETFQSFVSPSSQCESEVPLTIQMITSTFKERIEKKFPNEANCLTNEIIQTEVVDYILKINVLESSSMLNDSDKDAQLEDIRNQFKDELNRIAVQCAADDKNFTTIFNKAITKNETLLTYQRIYCLAKFIRDRELLDLHDVDTNPLLIDAEDVDCDSIIEVERIESEKDLNRRWPANKSEFNPCIVRTLGRDLGNGSFWLGKYISEEILRLLNIPEEVKQREVAKIHDAYGRNWYSVSGACFSN